MSKPGALWWQPITTGWASALSLTVNFDVYLSPPAPRGLGDWWRNGGSWCVHLDDNHYAGFLDVDISSELRRSFSWMIKQFWMSKRGDWRTWAGAYILRGIWNPSAELLGTQPQVISASVESFDEILPGYVLWLFLQPSSQLSEADIVDLRESVAQVLEATWPGLTVCWIPGAAQSAQYGICFVSEHNLQFLEHPMDLDEEENHVDSCSKEAPFYAHLRLILSELAQAIMAEAMVLCQITTSSKLTSLQDIYHALDTVVIGALTQSSSARPSSPVQMWGENPLWTLLQVLPKPAEAWFREAASLRFTLSDFRLSGDLADVLTGLIAANLNVSEASRLLYLHRNTLTNRIERIRQQTGYDIRNFDDALILYLLVALDRR